MTADVDQKYYSDTRRCVTAPVRDGTVLFRPQDDRTDGDAVVAARRHRS